MKCFHYVTIILAFFVVASCEKDRFDRGQIEAGSVEGGDEITVINDSYLIKNGLEDLRSFTELASVLNDEELRALKSLAFDKEARRISSWRGLEKFTALESIEIGQSSIHTLLDFPDLPVERIHLSNLPLESSDGLRVLANLEILGLSYCPLKKFPNIDSFRSLKLLNISGTDISTISESPGGPVLLDLVMRRTPVLSIEDIRGVLGKTIELDLAGSALEKIGYVESWGTVKKLLINNTPFRESLGENAQDFVDEMKELYDIDVYVEEIY